MMGVADSSEPSNSDGDGVRRDGANAPDVPDIDRHWIGRVWGSSERRSIAINLSELDSSETFDARMLFGGEAPVEGVPYDASAMPKDYRDLAAVDVLATGGPLRLELARVRPDPASRSADTFQLVTERSAAVGERLDRWTVVMPAGAMDRDASFEPIEAEPVEEEAVDPLREAVLQAIGEDGRNALKNRYILPEPGPKERHRLGETVLDEATGRNRELEAEHFSAAEASFPSPIDEVVTVNGPTGYEHDNMVSFPIVRALLLASDDGEFAEVVWSDVGPTEVDGHLVAGKSEIVGFGDLDGDGIDGVLYHADQDVRWLEFHDGTVVHP
jgi:hypothetical protein